jgi:hypothetical protein
MVKIFKHVAFLMALGIFLTPWAIAEQLSPEYFYGRWAIDAQDCSSPDTEYYEFQKKGTFEVTRTGQTEIIGFWEVKNDTMELHMLTSPAFYTDLHSAMAEFQGQFHYYPAKMLIFNIQKDSFEVFGLIGDQLDRASAVRCQ